MRRRFLVFGLLLACGGGTKTGTASVTAAEITPTIASSGTEFVSGAAPQAYGRYVVRLSTASAGGECDRLGSSPFDGLLGSIEIWSSSPHPDLAPGTYQVGGPVDSYPADGGVLVSLGLANQADNVEFTSASGTLTITSNSGGALKGSFQVTCDVSDLRSGPPPKSFSEAISGTFDAPLCSSSGN